MSGDYTLALSRQQYDEQVDAFRALENPIGLRDENTNLCDIGWSESDLAKILLAFEFEDMTEEFISKIERLLIACGTLEEEEIKAPLKWMKNNIGKSFVLIYEFV